MVNYKILLIITIMALCFRLSSCSSFRAELFARNDKEIADMRFENIRKAIENNDKESLKNMFSPNVLKEANDIDDGIEYLMEFYQGEIKSIESSRQGSDSKENGDKKSELKCLYRVTTDEDEYIIFFIDELIDTKVPENVGLYMLQMIKLKDRDEQFDWGNKIRCAGVYQPTE